MVSWGHFKLCGKPTGFEYCSAEHRELAKKRDFWVSWYKEGETVYRLNPETEDWEKLSEFEKAESLKKHLYDMDVKKHVMPRETYTIQLKRVKK